MNDREKLIDSLREFATFLEEHPDAPTPVAPRFDVFLAFKEELVHAAKAVGGKLEKKADYGSLMVLRRQFGPLQYDLNIDRDQVCERVIAGKRVVPAVEAQPEREEDVVEWKCLPILTGEA